VKMRSCVFFLVLMCSEKLLAAGKPCDLPHVGNGLIAQYYYVFKSYYFPMREEQQLAYSCLAGYTTGAGMEGGRTTCTAEGWSPAPHCYRKCSRPLLDNGVFYSTEMYFKIHQKLEFKCDPGYHTPSGGTEDTVQCQAEGWSTQPSCTKNLDSCQVPSLHHGSYLTAQQELRPDETLLYRCEEGYHAAGGNATGAAVCLAHGWSLTPSCTKRTCPALSGIAHGGFHPVKTTYEEGDVVHFFCEGNYSVSEFDLIQCYYFGWYPDPPVCEDVKTKCPPPPLPPHTQMTTGGRTFHHGDRVRVRCQRGFQREGSEEIRCEEGKWTSPPVCVGTRDELVSEEPPSLESAAEATQARETPVGEDPMALGCFQTVVSLTRLPALTWLSGSHHLSPPLMPEMQQDCSSPPEIKNALLLGPVLRSYKNGSSVEYVCQRYHLLDGPSTVYCEKGNWTAQPVCLEPCTLNVTEMNRYNVELKWKQEELLFRHGDLVEFDCKEGYRFLQAAAVSPGREQCAHGRLKYPRCVAQAPAEKCGPPPSIANGALTLPPLPQYDSRSSVQYRCSDYYFLQGPETISCSEGQWTSPPVCIEPCALSEDEMERNNLLLQGLYGNQVHFYHGDYVGFYCKENHLGAESGATLFQVQCRRGQLMYPKCIER
ncbi:F13B factor, partial [Rhinopomastus cyanomelas]|nr:F13B factor [Rhinopomastus cyanomelas]